MDSKGFTIIEIIMVLVLIVVVSAIAGPRVFRGPSPTTVAALARKVQDDIRYTQSLAMRRRGLDTPSTVDSNLKFRYRIRFNAADVNCSGAPSWYTIVNDSDYDGTWGEYPNGAGEYESARNPSDTEGKDYYFCVKLGVAGSPYDGMSVSANFGGTIPADTGVLEYDATGIPFNTDGLRLTTGSVVVSGGGKSVTITITPNTGSAVIQ